MPRASSSRCFSRREDAERFLEEVLGDEPEMAAMLRIEEREFERRLSAGNRTNARLSYRHEQFARRASPRLPSIRP